MIVEGTKIDSNRVKYPVVKEAFEKLGIDMTYDDQDAVIYWWDGDISNSDFQNIPQNMRINKIPGMDYLCYKSTFIHSMNQMRRLFPSYYKFFPQSFLLPHQFTDFQRQHTKLQSIEKGPVTWIVKPRSGCCGHGIRLIQHIYEISRRVDSVVVQRYIEPYLLNGYKFDFRLYILISTLNPYTVYIYKEGLARFCTVPYKPPSPDNLNDKFSHLTNTSINVENSEPPTGDFTRLASSVLEEITSQNPKGTSLWDKICEVSALTMLAMWPPIVSAISTASNSRRGDVFGRRAAYTTIGSGEAKQRYFHLLGIDIMLDHALRPIVLELNDRPSMQASFDCERELKPHLIEDELRAITATGDAPRTVPASWTQILPPPPGTPFAAAVERITQQSCSVFRTTAPVRSVPIREEKVKRCHQTFAETQ